VPVAGPGRACEATVERVEILTREVEDARRAVQIGKEIEARERAAARAMPAMKCEAAAATPAPVPAPARRQAPFGSSNGAGGTNGSGSGHGSPPRRVSSQPVNPSGSQENCVPVAIAAAKRDVTGLPYAAPHVSPQDTAPTHGGAFAMLRENF